MALEELKTKQAINKLRYISNNGKITYYQKNSGELQMSTNYNFANLIKLNPLTHYSITGSDAQKRIAIEANTQFHSKIDNKKDHLILSGIIGDNKKLVEIGNGVSPRLHLNDEWISFFQNKTQTLYFKSFNPNLNAKSVKLNQNFFRYFTPQVEMISPNDIIYTDINDEGSYAVFIYSFIENNFNLVYKAKQPGHKINICKIKNKLYIGEFPQLSTLVGSQILELDLYNNNQFKNFNSLYTSDLPDIGNMICTSDKIYFIKTTKVNPILNTRTTEVAALDIGQSSPANALRVLTDISFVTQILRLNNKLLTPFRGKLLIVEGKNNLTDDAIIDKKDTP